MFEDSSVKFFVKKNFISNFYVCKSLLSTAISEHIAGPQQRKIEHTDKHSSVPGHT